MPEAASQGDILKLQIIVAVAELVTLDRCFYFEKHAKEDAPADGNRC